MAKITPTHVLYLLPDSPDAKCQAVGPGWVNCDGSINLVVNLTLQDGARVLLRKREAASANTKPAAPTTSSPAVPASDS